MQTDPEVYMNSLIQQETARIVGSIQTMTLAICAAILVGAGQEVEPAVHTARRLTFDAWTSAEAGMHTLGQ